MPPLAVTKNSAGGCLVAEPTTTLGTFTPGSEMNERELAEAVFSSNEHPVTAVANTPRPTPLAMRRNSRRPSGRGIRPRYPAGGEARARFAESSLCIEPVLVQK